MSGVFKGVNYHVLPETYRRMGDNGENHVSLLKSERVDGRLVYTELYRRPL